MQELKKNFILTYLDGVLTSAPFSINCTIRSLLLLCIASISGVKLSYSMKDRQMITIHCSKQYYFQNGTKTIAIDIAIESKLCTSHSAWRSNAAISAYPSPSANIRAVFPF